MKSGQLARAAAVNVETLRYYERRGLLPEPVRRSSGYRDYPAEAVQIVRFIKRAQDLGFTLAEIQELLDLRDNEEASCREVREAALAKMEDIRVKMRRLRRMSRALDILVKSCRGKGSTRACPILEALDDGKGKPRR